MEQDYSYNQQDYQASNGYSGNEDSLMKIMIEVEPDLNRFEMEALRKKRLSVDLKTHRKSWVPIAPGVKPVCNEIGISEILGQIRGRATTIGRMTKKSDEEIMKDMFQFHMSLIELFTLRSEDWELDEELAKPLMESCIGLVQDIVFSCRNGFTAINIKSQYTRNENSNTTENPNQKTIMGVKVS